MSKMQMLIFATGVAVIGLLFLSFISGIELKTISQNTIITAEKIVVDRLSSDNLCSSNSLTFPDVLYYGIGGNTPFFYDIIFSKVDLGNYNSLVISISEHGKKTVLGSRSIPMKANIVLVDPGFILGENSLNPFYDKKSNSSLPKSSIFRKTSSAPKFFYYTKRSN